MTGKPYASHFSIWTTNQVHHYHVALKHRLRNAKPELDEWLNTDFYQPTNEVIGVLPIPIDIQHSNGLSRYIDSIQHPDNRKFRRLPRHQFLARLQGTRKAVLPVHTPAEQKLFHDFMQKDERFGPTSNGGPNWDSVVRIWNQTADSTDGIYYKVCRFLDADLYYDSYGNFVLAGRATQVILYKLEDES
jgi:hypothetical protein